MGVIASLTFLHLFRLRNLLLRICLVALCHECLTDLFSVVGQLKYSLPMISGIMIRIMRITMRFDLTY